MLFSRAEQYRNKTANKPHRDHDVHKSSLKAATVKATESFEYSQNRTDATRIHNAAHKTAN
jgi:hypothetical protein